MKDGVDKRADDIALFRYGVIADLIHLPRGTGSGLYERLREKSELSYDIPYSRRRRVAAETIRSWLSMYRQGGFEALKPKLRSDSGKSRRLPQEVVDLLCCIKEEQNGLTVAEVIAEARTVPDLVPTDMHLPISTVHRHLSLAGLMKKKRGEPSSKDLRRFAYQKAGELWMSDVMHGPSVQVDGRRKRKTYLIAFIDDATRVVPYAEFCLSENTTSFLPVFRQAVMRRGLPLRLFVDNGSVFVSKQLALVCAQLGVTLIHARPYHAAGKGKIERFFRTLRHKFIRLLGTVDSLGVLNQRLRLWLEQEYHHTPHRGLGGIAPFDAWCANADELRTPGPEVDLREMFLFTDKRKVQKDRTVSLNGTVYEVDASLVGQSVVIKHDPARPGAPVDIWHDGKKIETANVVDVYANCRVKRNHDTKALRAELLPDQPESTLKLRNMRNGKEIQ
ncbi:MAG: DDE-type integrase/transposase/recombinase [Myxococcota bacterium]|nr:DDE-type integrase/transposase/recombinase [Myxococcota bacterium]